jgi:hypothetical protein
VRAWCHRGGVMANFCDRGQKRFTETNEENEGWESVMVECVFL